MMYFLTYIPSVLAVFTLSLNQLRLTGLTPFTGILYQVRRRRDQTS